MGQRFPLSLMAECLGVPGQAVMQQPAGAAGLPGREAGTGGGLMLLAGDPVLAGIERLLAQVDRLCAVSPVVLVAEDLQWADEASVLVWYRLSRAVGQLPLLLAGSCRPQPGREDLARLRRGLSPSWARGPGPGSSASRFTIRQVVSGPAPEGSSGGSAPFRVFRGTAFIVTPVTGPFRADCCLG